jgi:hypothetical protein
VSEKAGGKEVGLETRTHTSPLAEVVPNVRLNTLSGAAVPPGAPGLVRG